MGMFLWLFVWLLIVLFVIWAFYTAPLPANTPPLVRWALGVIVGLFLLFMLIMLLNGQLPLPGVHHGFFNT